MDTTFRNGTFALYCKGENFAADFDDVDVRSTVTRDDSLEHFTYEFYNRLDISEDLSQWENGNQILSGNRHEVFTTKNLFESYRLFNRKIFENRLEANVRTYLIPTDVDLSLHLKSISDDHRICLTLMHDKILVKQDDDINIYPVADSINRSFGFAFQDESHTLKVYYNDSLFVSEDIRFGLQQYKFGLEFHGIGEWNINMPRVDLSADKYSVKLPD
jgi:hypothetical protein